MPFFITHTIQEDAPAISTGWGLQSFGQIFHLQYIRYGYNLDTMTKRIAKPPLTPAVLHILLALSTKPRHGYGIMKQVKTDSGGKTKMGPGTLYGSIGRMIEAGLICESDPKTDLEMDDARRVYYEITGLGQKALAAELERYREVVAVARRKQLTETALVSSE